jgi:hypothetical protein
MNISCQNALFAQTEDIWLKSAMVGQNDLPTITESNQYHFLYCPES